jgi:hypothetical protein
MLHGKSRKKILFIHVELELENSAIRRASKNHMK